MGGWAYVGQDFSPATLAVAGSLHNIAGMAHPPRLSTITYTEPGSYFLTTCTLNRRRIFENHEIVVQVLSHFLTHAEHCSVAISAYCFMPDHLHLLATTAVEGANVHTFMTRAKQASGHWYRHHHGPDTPRLWQAGFHDRVLRRTDDRLDAIAYLVANPLRAGLCDTVDDYPFWGSAECSRSDLLDAIATSRHLLR